jgi:hypothetical protein
MEFWWRAILGPEPGSARNNPLAGQSYAAYLSTLNGQSAGSRMAIEEPEFSQSGFKISRMALTGELD